jgi:hypothetical protein
MAALEGAARTAQERKMSDPTRYERGEIRITPAQLADAADQIVGVIDGVESVEAAQELLWAWFGGAVEQLIADAPTYATSPQRGFATRAFTDALARQQGEDEDTGQEEGGEA